MHATSWSRSLIYKSHKDKEIISFASILPLSVLYNFLPQRVHNPFHGTYYHYPTPLSPEQDASSLQMYLFVCSEENLDKLPPLPWSDKERNQMKMIRWGAGSLNTFNSWLFSDVAWTRTHASDMSALFFLYFSLKEITLLQIHQLFVS